MSGKLSIECIFFCICMLCAIEKSSRLSWVVLGADRSSELYSIVVNPLAFSVLVPYFALIDIFCLHFDPIYVSFDASRWLLMRVHKLKYKNGSGERKWQDGVWYKRLVARKSFRHVLSEEWWPENSEGMENIMRGTWRAQLTFFDFYSTWWHCQVIQSEALMGLFLEEYGWVLLYK